MTEEEWFAGSEPIPLLRACVDGLTIRRRRMLALAACRLVPVDLWIPDQQALLLLAEKLAERNLKLNPSGLRKRLDACWIPAVYDSEDGTTACAVLAHLLSDELTALFNCVGKLCDPDRRMPRTSKPLSSLIRDIVGNPFQPVAFSPTWRTDTAVTLAKQMNDSRDFGAMPILADALQDAGCDSADILNHCRDADQVHVRGCWVVDLVLGKA